MKTKLKAFTLFELVLGMLLAAIVIGMAYYASSIFIRLFDGYSKINSAQSELVLFKKVLSKDVERAAEVRLLDNELLLKDEAGSLMLSYEMGPDWVLRKGMLVDTFKLDSVLLKGTFEGRVSESGLTDALVFSLLQEKEPCLIEVNKHYSAADLFKLKN
uniref:hypothetical protein n=1 Tax=Pedobacter schmidteae TaxID=2201271 RepID=UPI000EAF540F|nr:hypothetical protein [Pedobacter schmidteae]